MTGPAGIGKTRLAIEVTRHLVSSYPDGVWWVELAGGTEAQCVVEAVADALRVRPQAGQPLVETLAGRLQHRRLLVVLDNAEHVLDGCRELARDLLPRCPGVHVLVTSQAPLGLPGERAWPLGPLSVPSGDRQLDNCDAVALFVERARDVQPCFVLDDRNRLPVADICRRLDGIPLAIELATARLDTLSPAEIVDRLDDRFELLARAEGHGLLRHRSLQAALEWSWELLDEPEQALLRRLSVFTDGCTLDAAEEVCGRGEIREDDVIGLLARLVGRSLVVADTTTAPTRYRLLQTVQAYATERLAKTGGADRLRTRHLMWCIHLAEQTEVGEVTDDGARPGPLAEYANVRAALAWALAAGRTDLAVRLAGALVPHWRNWGAFGEGLSWLTALAPLCDSGPGHLRARAMMGAASLATYTGSAEVAMRGLQEMVTSARRFGSSGSLAQAVNLLGFVSMKVHGPGTALPLLEESVELARQADDHSVIPRLLAGWGAAYRLLEDAAAAKPIFEDCLATGKARGDDYASCAGVLGLGWVALTQGDANTAEPLLAEALDRARGIGERYETTVALACLAEAARIRGEREAALHLAQEAVQLARPMRTPYPLATAMLTLGALCLGGGELDQAANWFQHALDTARQASLRSREARAMQGLAEVARAQGDLVGAEDGHTEALELARGYGDQPAVGRSLHGLAVLSKDREDYRRAASLEREALELRAKILDRLGLAESFETLAGLLSTDQCPLAARLLGGAAELRRRWGLAPPSPAERLRIEADLAVLRGKLGAETFATACDEGRRLPVEEMVTHALRRKGSRQRPGEGWAALTSAELEVVALAKERLTNKEIGERLFISPRTVQNHLAHVFTKLDVSSRRELRDIARSEPR